MRVLFAIAALALTACENPSWGVGARISGSGVSVSPTVSGDVGGATVLVSG